MNPFIFAPSDMPYERLQQSCFLQSKKYDCCRRSFCPLPRPKIAVFSLFTIHDFHDPNRLHFAQILFRLSHSGNPIQATLFRLSRSGYPIQAIPFRRSCSGYPVQAIPFRLFRSIISVHSRFHRFVSFLLSE